MSDEEIKANAESHDPQADDETAAEPSRQEETAESVNGDAVSEASQTADGADTGSDQVSGRNLVFLGEALASAKIRMFLVYVGTGFFLLLVILSVLAIVDLREPEEDLVEDTYLLWFEEPEEMEPRDIADFEVEVARAEQLAAVGRVAEAEQIWRGVADKFFDVTAKRIFAKYRICLLLFERGSYEDTWRMASRVTSIAEPGSDLWKNAMLVKVMALYEDAQPARFRRQWSKLRANTGRYEDEERLNRRLAYFGAMHHLHAYKAEFVDNTTPFDIDEPRFGRSGRPDLAPLTLQEVESGLEPTASRPGECELKIVNGEYRLRAYNADLGEVLAEFAENAGAWIHYDEDDDITVTADYGATSLSQCLEVLAASVGLEAREITGDMWELAVPRPKPVDKITAYEDAEWAVRGFILEYPESEFIDEAHFALAYLLILDRSWVMAIDQLAIMLEETRHSPWIPIAHYLKGAMFHERGSWSRVAEEMGAFINTAPEHRLAGRAFYLKALAFMELAMHTDAISSFRRALTPEMRDKRPEILFNLAYCLDQSGADPKLVKDRYIQVKTLDPLSDYARKAHYRVGRMMEERGHIDEAIRLYVEYIDRWGFDQDRGPEIARTLLESYIGREHFTNASLLFDVIIHSEVLKNLLPELLPDALKAARRAGLTQLGLEWLEKADYASDDPRGFYIDKEKARLLISVGEYDKAMESLKELYVHDTAHTYIKDLDFLRAEILIAKGQQKEALGIWSNIARDGEQDQQRRALLKMGRYFEQQGEFDKAATAFGGDIPWDAELWER